MVAGPELDQLIVEKVMGLWVDERGVCYQRLPATKQVQARSIPVINTVPYYSTDITAAWEVVNHMFTTHRLRLSLGQRISGMWDALFGTSFDVHFEYQAVGDTAPHAICLAALKKLGTPV